LFILLHCTCVRAQTDATLQLLAKPLGNKIQLRWAPTDYPTWSLMQRYGVVVERRTLGPNQRFSPITAERIAAYSVADFKGLADTNNVHIIAVAEALHGEATPGTREGEMGAALDLYEEQTQRLFLAQLNADLSAEAAHCLGWSFTDDSPETGVPYDYRIRLLAPDTLITSPVERLRAGDHYDTTAPQELTAIAGDAEVILTWSLEAEVRFTAYHLERSVDGSNWERPLDVPFVAEADEEEFRYAIDVPQGSPNYQFRLRGIDPFAWVSPPTPAVQVALLDRTPPPPPSAIRGSGKANGTNALTWTFNHPEVTDLQGFRVVRGPSIDGPFTAATLELLPARITAWTDENPLPGQTNFYAIEAVDQRGNTSRGPVNFVRPFDNTPPVTPVGLTGRIDTMGRVFLIWEPGEAPDLLGYRVYRSHARNREFLQITEEVQHRNFFFDSTTLLVLNETVLYKIVAVDQNYNPSDYSVVLELRRPDKVAPATPSIAGYSARGNSVTLTLRPSESVDVVRQTIWRAEGNNAPRPLAVILPKATTFRDTTTASRTAYSYTVRAEDEVGLFGESAALVVRTGAVTDRATVLDLARTQVQSEGKSKEVLRWSAPASSVTGFQVYQGPSAESLRPSRRLGGSLEEWPIPDPTQYYALRVIYDDGSRSPLSVITEPLK
ncbi:MAG: hypothetical protein AAF597_02820, partial [Bacteroidota bacterium]